MAYLRIDSGVVGIAPLDPAVVHHAVYRDGRLLLYRSRGQETVIEGPDEIMLAVACYLRDRGVRVSGAAQLDDLCRIV